MTSELRTPEQIAAENALICEKLLGWKRSSIVEYWYPSQDHAGSRRTPSFTTWAEAGLLLDALAKTDWDCQLGYCRIDEAWFCNPMGKCIEGPTGPLAVRECALEYIKAVKP